MEDNKKTYIGFILMAIVFFALGWVAGTFIEMLKWGFS